MKARVFPFIVVLIITFLILWVRLFYLQIVRGAKNQALAENNRIKINKIPAGRGVIYDRNDQVLARNRPEGRDYVYKEALAHVLGYVGESDKPDLKGVIVGKTGIERQCDDLLRGKDGGVLVETDANGKVIREIKKQDSEPGKSITLTLDEGLQKKAFEALKNRKGAVVVADPNTGEILSLVSSPSFDPNDFILKKPSLSQILTDPDQPLFNRAISGEYPPGSTFKIITSIAGLEEGKIDASTLVEDTGEIKVGGSTFGNWYFIQYGKTEGQVNLIKAIKRSNDIFFYHVGEWVGITKLITWAKYFGLGQNLGIDLPGEANGLLPTPEWKKQTKLEDWYLGDTYITAIGQGNVQLTPLQVNHAAAIIAANGKACQPHLLKDDQKKDYCQNLKINPTNLSLIREGMK